MQKIKIKIDKNTDLLALVNEEGLSPLQRLRRIMQILRNPDVGCAWDLKQDFSTIAPHTIEEAYEVADAVDSGDMEALKDELGDLLLQVIFHSQMADDKGLFDFDDVARSSVEKMLERHPHVFGDAVARTPEDVVYLWNKGKDEKEEGKTESVLDNITGSLPPLLKAQKLQARAGRAGFEWSDDKQAYAKIEEEIQEFKQAVETGTHDEMLDELGDVLFTIVKYATLKGLNSEEAMRRVNKKFEKRFRGMEKDMKSDNIDMKSASQEEFFKYWNMQKTGQKKDWNK